MTVNKRRITVPERQLAAVADMASVLAHQWSAYEATCAALAPPTIAAAGEPGRSGNTPNPTATIALGHEQYDDTREAVHAWLEQGRWLTSRVTGTLREHHDLARDADATLKALRCDGTVDPTCTRNAVKGGLCHACIKRRQRASTPDGGHVHRDQVDSGKLTTRDPVEPQLPATFQRYTAVMACNLCGETFRAEGADDVQARADVQDAHDRHQCRTVASA